MASKLHTVKKYNYSFDARTGGPSIMQLWGDNGLIADVKFVEDNAAVPAPTFTPDLNKATIHFKRSTHAGLVDMLRNESPVLVIINNQAPGFVSIITLQEPAGEGEH